MKTLNQRGSSHLVLILAVIVLAGVSFAGYRVMNSSEASTPDVVSSKAGEPDSIKSTADVKKASAALEDTAIDGPVNPAQLDSDMQSLL